MEIWAFNDGYIAESEYYETEEKAFIAAISRIKEWRDDDQFDDAVFGECVSNLLDCRSEQPSDYSTDDGMIAVFSIEVE